MKITALSTGTVQLKETMARGKNPRTPRLFLPSPLGQHLPIHAWLIEHADGPLLIDTGSRSDIAQPPFARFHVKPSDHIDVLLEHQGVSPSDLKAVVSTHVHSDHADGLRFLPGVPHRVAARELRVIRSFQGRLERRFIKAPLAAGFNPTTFGFGDGPIGAFAESYRLTVDGLIRAVPTPGHTAGHVSILINEGDHDVLIAGDATYSQAQLLGDWIDGVSTKPREARATMKRIRAHAAQRPTVYLPSHDPESAERLRQRTVLPAA